MDDRPAMLVKMERRAPLSSRARRVQRPVQYAYMYHSQCVYIYIYIYVYIYIYIHTRAYASMHLCVYALHDLASVKVVRHPAMRRNVRNKHVPRMHASRTRCDAAADSHSKSSRNLDLEPRAVNSGTSRRAAIFVVTSFVSNIFSVSICKHKEHRLRDTMSAHSSTATYPIEEFPRLSAGRYRILNEENGRTARNRNSQRLESARVERPTVLVIVIVICIIIVIVIVIVVGLLCEGWA